MKQLKLNFFVPKTSETGNIPQQANDASSPTATCTARPINSLPSTTVPTPLLEQGKSDTLSSGTHNKGKFKPGWCKIFSWLLFEENRAKCSVCLDNPRNCDEKWLNGFEGPFKKETFVWHSKSATHKDNEHKRFAKNDPGKTMLGKCIKKMEASMFEHLTNLFRVAYFIAFNEKPFTDFPRQVDLAMLLTPKVGLLESKQYVNDMYCKTFIHYIAEQLQNSVIDRIKQSPFFSILLDGSTDRSSEEHVIIYARYLYDGKICEDLLALAKLESGTAEHYFEAVTTVLDNKIPEWKRNKYLVSVGTDGASSMMGNKSGLVTRLRAEVPHAFSVHCVAHRLQLAILDATEDSEYINTFDSALKGVVKLYHRSPKLLHELKITAGNLEVDVVKLRQIHAVRWLTSKNDSMKALKKDLVPIIVHLEHISNGNSNNAAKAKGLLKDIKSFKFVKFLHFLIDLYGVLQPLCKVFQSEGLLLSQVKSKVNATIENVQMLSKEEGKNVKTFLEHVSPDGHFHCISLLAVSQGEKQYQLLRKKLVNTTQEYLKVRLDSMSSVVGDNCYILDPFNHPTTGVDSEDFINFGNREIIKLVHHFTVIDTDHTEVAAAESVVLSEWMELKYFICNIRGQEKENFNFTHMLQKINHFPDRFQSLREIINGVACSAVSTSSCERGFSFVNRIKNCHRLSLTLDSLGDLLQVAVNGPPIDSFDPSRAIDMWYFTSSTRKRHTDGHRHKSTNK